MKKLLSLILVLCMIFALTACGQQAAEESVATAAPTEAPTEAQETVSELIGGYRFDYVAPDFTEAIIVVSLQENFFRINPHDDSGKTFEGTEWTDNGDGSFTTGPCGFAYEFANADGSCTWIITDANTVVPDGYVKPEAPVVAEGVDASFVGSYTFVETNEFGLTANWTLTLKADGTYILAEDNDFVGHLEYPGDTWAASGNVVQCGPLTGDKPDIDNWATAAEGFTVTINEDGTFVNGGEYVPSAGSAGGTYTFNETNEFGLSSTWVLELKTDGTYVLKEENDFIGSKEYPGDSWTMDGSTVVCGPLTGDKPGIENWATAAEGFTVTINEDGTFTAG